MGSFAPLFSEESVTKSDFVGLEERFDRLEQRFDRLEERFYDLQKSINDQMRTWMVVTVGAMTGLTGIFVGAVSLLD